MELGSLLSKPESAIMAATQESPAVYKESPWALEADFQCGGPTTDASASAQHPESVQWSQVWGSQSNFHHRLCFSVMVDSLPVLSMEALYPLSALLWPRRLFLNSLLRHDHNGLDKTTKVTLEPSVCPVTTKEAAFELAVCPNTVIEAVYEPPPVQCRPKRLLLNSLRSLFQFPLLHFGELLVR